MIQYRIRLIKRNTEDRTTTTIPLDPLHKDLPSALMMVTGYMTASTPQLIIIDIIKVDDHPPPGPQPMTDIYMRFERVDKDWAPAQMSRYVG